MMDEKIKALVFDVDGTLADTMPVHYEAWKEVGKTMGFDFPEDLFYEISGVPTDKTVLYLNELLHCNLDPAETVKEKEKYYLQMLDKIKPIEPVITIARSYYGILPLGIGTSGKRYITDYTLKTVEIDALFDVIVTAEDVKRHKPAPDVFLRCAEMLHVPASSCLVFEDSAQGIEAATEAGMDVVDVGTLIEKM